MAALPLESVHATAPVRIDLAGGTLDIWPLYLAMGGTTTVNAALDLPVEARVAPADGPSVTLRSEDLDREMSYADPGELGQALADGSCPLPLLGHAVAAVAPPAGLTLTTRSTPPPGSGLGGSSALLGAVLGALLEACGRGRIPRDIQPLAQDVETSLLRAPTGHQDYFPPLLGGCLALHAGVGGIQIERLSVDLPALAGRLRLAYTGEPHESGFTNWGVVKAWLDGERTTRDAFQALAGHARATAAALREGDLDAAFAAMLADGDRRRGMAAGVTTPGIEALDAAVRAAGALGTKICGAGGGGCVLVLLPDEATGAAVDSVLDGGPWEPLPLRLVETGLTLDAGNTTP